MTYFRFFRGVSLLLGLPALLMAQPSPQAQLTAQQYVIQGMTRAFQRDWKEAIQFYEQALQVTPDQPAVLLALSEAHEASQNRTSALFYAQQALRIAPKNPVYVLQAASLHDQSENTRVAIQALTQYLATQPNDVSVLQPLAGYQQKAGDTAGMTATLERLVVLEPEVNTWIARLEEVWRKMGDWNKIIALLRPKVDQNPADKFLVRLLIGAYEQSRQTQALATLLDQALAADPYDVDLQLRKRDLNAQPADSRASSVTVQVIPNNRSIQPEQIQAYFVRAEQDAAARAEVLQLSQRFLEREPAHAEVQLMRGKALFWNGQFAEAGATLLQVLRKNPKDLVGWVMTVEAFTEAQDGAQAVSAADEAGFLFPGQPKLLIAQSKGYLLRQKPADAQRVLTEAASIIQSDFGNETALRVLLLDAEGDLFAQQGQQAAARSKWQEALRLDPAQSTIKIKLGGARQ